MAFFDNVLKNSDKILGNDLYADPTKEDPFKKWVFTFNAQPKKEVKVNHSMTKQYEWAGESKKESEKTAGKVSIDHGECITNYGFANDKFTFGAAANAMREDNTVVDVTTNYETKPAKSEWKVDGTAKISAKDLGGANAFVDFTGEYNQNQKVTLKPKVNVQYDEWNVGFSGEHDTKEFKKAWTQIACDKKESAYYARVNHVTNKLFTGCHQNLGKNVTHSFEGTYGWKDFKGFKGHPVELRFGTLYKLSPETTLIASASASENVEAHMEATHKINNNVTFGIHQDFNSKRLNGNNAYDLGFNLTYNL